MEYYFNNPAIYIVGAFVIMLVVYYIFIFPKTRAKYVKQGEDLRASLKGNEGLIRKSYFEGKLKPIANALGTSDIIGAVECTEKKVPRGIGTQIAVDTAGKVLEKLTGIEIETSHYNAACYLVFTNTHLFYVAFDDNKCKERLSFSLDEMRQVTLRKTDMFEHKKHEGAAGAEKLLFNFNGSDLTFFYNNQISYSPDKEALNRDDYSRIYITIVETFIEKIATLKQ